MLQFFRDLVRATFRNVVLSAGAEGIQEGVTLLARELATLSSEDAARAQPMLTRLGVPAAPPPTPQPRAERLPAAPVTPPAVLPAPPLDANTNDGRQEPRRGPGRPRKLPPHEGGTEA